MSKRSGPLNYTPVTDTQDQAVTGEFDTHIKRYIVTFFDAVKGIRQLFGTYTNYMQAFRACKRLTGSTPRCILLLANRALADFGQYANAAKMPH